ncbi:KICSTOR subunit 2-like [Styela clava]
MEESYFRAYFNFISTVACDKAKELVEKEKDKAPIPLQSALVLLAQCEKSYYSLAFLEQKWFGRRDPLKNTYLTLQTELQTVLKQMDKTDKSVTVSTCEGLVNFCSCRVDCIELYETALRNIPNKDLEKLISDLIQKHESKLQYHTLKSILDSFMSEFETFRQLVGASLLIAEWNFFTSLIELHKIHQTLAVWQPLLSKDQHHTLRPGLFGFGERHSTSPVSALYQWMAKYFQSLVSKFSFYFYYSLNFQGQGDEMKIFLSKTSYDYVAKALNFCKKLDSTYVLLCSIANENTSKLMDESLRTTHSKILELPNASPEYMWPNLDVFLYNKSEEITFEKVVYYFDKQIDFTFYAAQCDPGIMLVIAVMGRKNEKDSYVSNFINETVLYLRPKRIFSLLRPGSK